MHDWENLPALYLTCRNNKQLHVGVCLCVIRTHTAVDSGRADTSFDDQRLKRLFGCWGWKLPPDWCMNIITLDKKHLCTHPHSIFQMDFQITDVAVATQPCYLWYCGALWSKKKKEMKNRKRNWAQSVGQIQPAERRRADTDISEDVKGGQTSACAAGNYCEILHKLCATKSPHPGCCRKAGEKARHWHLPTGLSLSQLYSVA